MDSFYVTLPSDASLDFFPENKRGHYTTKVKQDINLVGQYEVAIVELQYKHDFYNFTIPEKTPVFYLLVPQNTLQEKVEFKPDFYQPSLYALKTSKVFEVLAMFAKAVDSLWKLGDMYLPSSTASINVIERDYSGVKNSLNLEILLATEEFNSSQILEHSETSLYRLYTTAIYFQKIRQKMRDSLISHTEEGLQRLKQIDEAFATVEKELEDILQMHGLAVTPANRLRRNTELLPAPPTTDNTNPTQKTASDGQSSELSSIYFQLKTMQNIANEQQKFLSKIVETLQQQTLQDGRLKSTVMYSTVPIINIPNYQKVVGDTPVYRIPVHARSGYYETPQKLIESLNASIKHNKFIKNADKLASFSYDWSLGKIKLHLDNNISIDEMDPIFKNLIGFTDVKETKNTLLATSPTKFHEKWQLMYIYSDVVDYNYVGDSMSQLLRCMPVQGERDAYTVIRFDSPHFVPVLKGGISTLEIVLANEYAERFPIRSGKTVVKLMFRPRVKHIF